MVVDDFDGDGQLDVLLSGNDFGTEPVVGRYDAMNGLLLKGDGKGNFTPMPMSESGICLPGDQKALVKLRGAGNRYWVAAGQNRGPLQVYEWKSPVRCIPLLEDDVSAKGRIWVWGFLFIPVGPIPDGERSGCGGGGYQ